MAITIFQTANKAAFDAFKLSDKFKRFLKKGITKEGPPVVETGRMRDCETSNYRHLLKAHAEPGHTPRVTMADLLPLLEDTTTVYYYVVTDNTKEDHVTYYLLERGIVFQQTGVEI